MTPKFYQYFRVGIAVTVIHRLTSAYFFGFDWVCSSDYV